MATWVAEKSLRKESPMKMRTVRFLFTIFAGVVAPLAPSFAWDYEGHRVVNHAALASLPTNFPAFVLAPEARERIAFLSGEPDRWRNKIGRAHV